jgi:hypothetical protein
MMTTDKYNDLMTQVGEQSGSSYNCNKFPNLGVEPEWSRGLETPAKGFWDFRPRQRVSAQQQPQSGRCDAMPTNFDLHAFV